MSLSPKAISILEEARDLVTLIRLIDGDFDPINLDQWVYACRRSEEIRTQVREFYLGIDNDAYQELYDYFKDWQGAKLNSTGITITSVDFEPCKTAATLYFLSLEYETTT